MDQTNRKLSKRQDVRRRYSRRTFTKSKLSTQTDTIDKNSSQQDEFLETFSKEYNEMIVHNYQSDEDDLSIIVDFDSQIRDGHGSAIEKQDTR